MSNRNGSRANAVLRRESRKKRMYRLIALILVILLAGSGFVSIAIYLITYASAAEPAEYNDIASEYNAAASDSMKIAVGLMYGSDVTTGFETTTTEGYVAGIQYLDGNRDFFPLWRLGAEVVSVTCDYNLSKSLMTYSITDTYLRTMIGGYHAELSFRSQSSSEAAEVYKNTTALLGDAVYCFPAYIGGEFRVRIGDYANEEDALASAQRLSGVLGYEITVAGPSATAVSVVNPYTDRILFEFDGGDTAFLGLRPYSSDGSDVYIKTPAANLYAGVFAYRRYSQYGAVGVSVINVVSLEDYVASVLPYEISNSWPLETQKAFAVTVRSYTIANLNRHTETYGFDLCNSQHCQVYKGVRRVNDAVKAAVGGTAGMVLTCEGEICSTYYSSSTGGCTVNSGDAWGGANKSYLAGKSTPWEDYLNCNNGFWTTEVSPSELLAYLRDNKGYTKLQGSVASVRIGELCDDSTYIYSLVITDTYGNTVTIRNSDSIRTALARYVNSANFVVGKGAVGYTETTVTKPEAVTAVHTPEEPAVDFTADRDYGYTGLGDYYIKTGSGTLNSSITGAVTVFTGDGSVEYGRNNTFVLTKENAAAFLGYETASSTDSAPQTTEPVTETTPSKREIVYSVAEKTAYAQNPDNFIIVGKGWGHGVGMSQYGARDLAEFGYAYGDILASYFNGTSLVGYRDYLDAAAAG